MARVTLDRSVLPRQIENALERGMQKGGLYLAGKIQESINRGNRDGKNPSEPGEPPKKVTGRLFKSIASVTAREPDRVLTRVGTNVEYGRALELGTTRMAPRPYLRPALATYRDDFFQIATAEAAKG